MRLLYCCVAIAVLTTSGVYALDGCFSIVVGKDASVDGCVIMAHNEDDWPPQVVNHRKEQGGDNPRPGVVELLAGGEEPEWSMNRPFIWSEMPDFKFSDSFLNARGVCVASDNCPSREDAGELTDGGITKKLRQLIARRASWAREGVHIAGELVEKFGYGAPGRTYIIADPTEGWLFAVVNGKHWVAQRVPDDEVALIANTYSIHEIDLSDTLNYLGSEDLVEYAIEKGWYDPDKGPFDFAVAYAHPHFAADSSNIGRQWAGLNFIAASPVAYAEKLPFSVKPANKLDLDDVMAVMRNHYEGTVLEKDDPKHRAHCSSICNPGTMTSFVAQLRHNDDLPFEIGCVYWVTLGPPCGSPYLPIYYGIEAFPDGWINAENCPSKEYYLERVNRPFSGDAASAFWTFSNFSSLTSSAEKPERERLQKVISDLENRWITRQ
ncbi:C69 family dipeptidase, partial [bacterium]|nr:C69 family dipeptidase [bacterium]